MKLKITYFMPLLVLFSNPVWGVRLDLPEIDSFSLHGKTYSRWMITGQSPGYSPFHSAFIADLTPTVVVNPNLTLHYLLRLQNPSVSDGYDAMQGVIGRYNVEFRRDINAFGFQSVIFEIGDLGKTTLGNGLLLKDFESQGFDLKIKPESDWVGGLRYIGHGYSDPGDYAVLYGHTLEDDLGGYLFCSIDDSQYFRTYTNILGLYSQLQFSPFLVNLEASCGLDGAPHSSAPAALLLSPKWSLKDDTGSLEISLTARYYTEEFNTFFQKYPFHKTYHGIEEESQDFDNWRNYLLHSFLSSGHIGNSKGISARIKGTQHIWGALWGYGDVEWTSQYYSDTTINYAFYKVGGEIRLSERQHLYAGLSNKVLASDAAYDYSKYGNYHSQERDSFSTYNVPVFVQADPFFEIGATIEF
ncbi:hypothetical protein EB093_05400 [bacterium]|nr:hypothetical protein [bacterium]